VDHIGRLGVGAGVTHAHSRRYTTLESIVAQRFPEGSDRVGRDRASSIIKRHSRAMLQVNDHQVISQGSR